MSAVTDPASIPDARASDAAESVTALREIAFWLDRAGSDARKAQAFRRSADIVADTSGEVVGIK